MEKKENVKRYFHNTGYMQVVGTVKAISERQTIYNTNGEQWELVIVTLAFGQRIDPYGNTKEQSIGVTVFGDCIDRFNLKVGERVMMKLVITVKEKDGVIFNNIHSSACSRIDSNGYITRL